MPYPIWGLDAEQWNVANVIGTWVAGLASTGAVIVALRLASRASRPRVQVGVRLKNIYINSAQPSQSTEVVEIAVTNIGDRKIVVSEIGWQVGLLKTEHVNENVSKYYGAVLLPAALEHGETRSWIVHTGDLFDPKSWTRTFTELMLRDRGQIGVMTLRATVSITTGKTFYAKPRRDVLRTLKHALTLPRPTY